jgi:thiol:disulfide interchange protein
VVKRINADIDDGPTIMRDYRILGHPTLLFFNKEGQELERLVGPQAEAVVEDSLHIILTNTSQN